MLFYKCKKNATTEHDGTYLKIHNAFPKNLIILIITASLLGTLPSIFLNKTADHTLLKQYRTYFLKTIFFNHTLHIYARINISYIRAHQTYQIYVCNTPYSCPLN